MKLKDAITGEIWDVDYVSATHKDGRVWNFFSNYELIPDESQSSYDPHTRIDTLREAINHNTVGVERLTSTCNSLMDRVCSLESNNQRLKDRLNAIEGLGIPR